MERHETRTKSSSGGAGCWKYISPPKSLGSKESVKEITVRGRRVVVTGLGVVTPVGIGVEAAWQALCKGESGIRRITRFDISDFPTRIAGEVVGFDPNLYIEKKEIKKMDLFIQYAMAAGARAREDSGLPVGESNAEHVGVMVGCGLGGLPSIERYHHILEAEGHRKVSPFFIPMMLGNMGIKKGETFRWPSAS